MKIWRPTIPTSSDGEPLATTVAQLFWEFNYDHLPENTFVALLLRPEIVVLSLLLYLLATEPLLHWIIKTFGVTGKSNAFIWTVAIHNLTLAIFSFVVALNAWSIAVMHLMKHGWRATYCDHNGTFWHSGYGTWATIFYISKYWEFLDTWVLVLKGKKPSFLQIYHHAGIVLSMWGGILAQASWLLPIVLLNSVIHTVMYVYFFVKTIYPKTEIKAARYLTRAQIVQFFTAILSTLGIHFMGSQCASYVSRFLLACVQIYGIGLIVLFTAFASKKYKKK